MRRFASFVFAIFSFALLSTTASARYEEYHAYGGHAILLTSAIGSCNMPDGINEDMEETGVQVAAVACHASRLVGPDGQPLRVMLEIPGLPDKEVTMFFGTGYRAKMADTANMVPVLAISFPAMPEEQDKAPLAIVAVKYANQLHPIVLMDGKAVHAMTFIEEKMKEIHDLTAKISAELPKIIQ